MQLTFDSDVEEFRAEFSAFLDEHLPSEEQTLERPRSVSHMPQWARDWQRLLFDNGWLLPAQPPEFAALALHIADNRMLNGEVIRLDGALRMPPK